MTLTTQFYTLVAMIGMGSYFGATLDTYQLFLKRSQRKRWIVFIHDILFWIVQALQVFYVLLLVNQGELRFYSFLALICGFAAYQALFKKGYLHILETVIKIGKTTASFIKKVIMLLVYKPIVAILQLLVLIGATLIKSLFALAYFLWRVILAVMKIICSPFVWCFRRIYKLFPISVTNKVEKLYNYIEGFLRKAWNNIYRFFNKGKNQE
ncbi:MAG: spore cortex biosynthesis protein YabQ [Bacillus sp. (in: firmicutes)]